VQRKLCAEAAPTSVRRVFTLRQFGRLAALVEPASVNEIPTQERWSAMLRAVTAARECLQPAPADQDDLADPIGLDLPAFHETAHAAEAALAPILRLIVTA
jgi:protein-tyrosine phosphatase